MNTDSLCLKFSTIAILRDLAEQEQQDEDDVVWGHLQLLRLTMDCITNISADLGILKVHFVSLTAVLTPRLNRR